MKRYLVAAGALLLGSSALAWAADADTTGKDPVDKDKVQAAELSGDKFAWADKTDAKLALAPGEWPDPSAPKLQSAGYESWSDDPDKAKLVMASADMDGPGMKTGQDHSAMGGPVEPGGATALASLEPRPATRNYPACDAGPGDDNCIQLYEPGVRAGLASWDRATGGLADGSQAAAMGGPYEPVAEPAVDADVTDPSLAGHADHQGIGGPIVSQSGYPPCGPGPGDDRCIQLYERGVTGAGN